MSKNIDSSAMLTNPPTWWQKISSRFFKHLHLDQNSAQKVKEAADLGQIIYIMRAKSVLDYLAFNQLFLENELPLAKFANGVNLNLFRGFKIWITDLVQSIFQKSDSTADGGLATHLSYGDSALIFLRERQWISAKRTSPIFFETIIAYQRKIETPIFLVPQLIHWPPAPPSKQRTLLDILFGNVEESGRIRKIIHFIRYAKNASVRLGEPINLQEFLNQHADWSDVRSARHLRRLLFVHLHREALSIHGPPIKAVEQLKDEMLDRKGFQSELAQIAQDKKVSSTEALAEAREYLNEIAAKPSFSVLMLVAKFLDILFFRVFEGVETNEEDIQKVKDAAKNSRNAPLVLVPSHKSHVDYLVVSWLFLRNDFIPAHVAAGANLSFFPLGSLLRRCGAFFLRRSFNGLDIYKLVFKHYLWKLVREGYPVEFFIEGGRSRTGKLLMPKMGMMSMLLEGVRRGEFKDLQFIPINLSYERVVETASYKKELTGGEKEAESVKGVVNASKVFRSRYGRIYTHFENPVFLSDYLKSRGKTQLGSDEKTFREDTQKLSFYLMHKIQDATVVPPSALIGMVLLSHERRGMSQELLLKQMGFLIDLCLRRKSRLSKSILLSLSEMKESEEEIVKETQSSRYEKFGNTILPLMDEAVNLLKKLIQTIERNQRTIYVVSEKSRIELDYYRSPIVGILAPEIIICATLVSFDRVVTWEEFAKRSRWLSELFKLEFIYRNDQPFDQIMLDAMQPLCEMGVIEKSDRGWQVQDIEHAQMLSGALRHLIESYWIAGTTLLKTEIEALDTKIWLNYAREQAELAYLEGDLLRTEASATVTLANAAQWFITQGLVIEETTVEGKKKTKKYKVIQKEKVEALCKELSIVLREMSEGPNPSADRQFRLQRQAAETLKAQADAQREQDLKKKKQTQTIPPVEAPSEEELQLQSKPPQAQLPVSENQTENQVIETISEPPTTSETKSENKSV